MNGNKKARHFHGNVLRDSGTLDIHMSIVSERVTASEVKYKVAYCSPHDQFSKRKGIEVAEASDKEYIISIRERDTYSDINFAIIVDLVKNRDDAPKYHRQFLTDIFTDVVFNTYK